MWQEDCISLTDVTDSVKQLYHQLDWSFLGDFAYSISISGVIVGQIHVSLGVDDSSVYIEWIEFFGSYHGLHLLKPVLEKVGQTLSKSTLYLDADIDLVPKYLSIGARIAASGYDDCREMVSLEYVVGCKATPREERQTFLIVYNDSATAEDNILYREFNGNKQAADEYAKVCTAICQDTGSGFEGPCRAILKNS